MSDKSALKLFVQTPVTKEMVQHLVVATLKVVKPKNETTCSHALTHEPAYPSPPASPNSRDTETSYPSLMTFIVKLVNHSHVYTGTLMATLVLLHRFKKTLPPNTRGQHETCHRIFLSCLIIAAKSLNDSSPKNCHWAQYTDGLFTVQEVNLMERQFLSCIGWDVSMSEAELTAHLRPFLEPIKADLRRSSEFKRMLHHNHSRQRSVESSALPDGIERRRSVERGELNVNLSFNGNSAAPSPNYTSYSSHTRTYGNGIEYPRPRRNLSHSSRSSRSSMSSVSSSSTTPEEIEELLHVPYQIPHDYLNEQKHESYPGYKPLMPMRDISLVNPYETQPTVSGY